MLFRLLSRHMPGGGSSNGKHRDYSVFCFSAFPQIRCILLVENSFRMRCPGMMVIDCKRYGMESGGSLCMLAMARSCAVVGLEGALIEVEVDLSTGMAAFSIVGLPDAAVNEAKERVRSAIKNSGCSFPFKRITVKSGTGGYS